MQTSANSAADLYGIRRVDKPGASLHFIVQVRRQSEIRTRTFSVARCGSEARALQAATAWRDETVQSMQPMLRSAFAAIVRPNNTSGVPGVVRCVIRSKTSTGVAERHYWRAVAPKNGAAKVPRTKVFNIERHGDEKAFRLAVEARERFLRECEGYHVPNAPKQFVPAWSGPVSAA